MKDNVIVIILSVVIIFLVGAGVVLMATNNDSINVSATSNPNNNAEGNPSVVPQNSDSQSVGYSARPGDVLLVKIVDYDDITTGGVQIFATSTGQFYLDNLIMETASSTIASGTAFQVYTVGETYGNSETVFDTNVAAFAKNTTMDLNTQIDGAGYTGYASSTQRVVLDDQSALYVKCTTASCKPSTNRTLESAANGTTYGFVKFTAVLKRVDSGSSIYE